jgi:hypothetical protein
VDAYCWPMFGSTTKSQKHDLVGIVLNDLMVTKGPVNRLGCLLLANVWKHNKVPGMSSYGLLIDELKSSACLRYRISIKVPKI